jgi:hypothetical protein
MNPIQIKQLKLNPVINEKNEMFKGMSNKKRATAIKTQQKLNKERQCINPHRSTISVVQRQTMYHGPL